MFSVHVVSTDGSVDGPYVFSRVPVPGETVEVRAMGVTVAVVRVVRHYADVDPQTAVVARVDVEVLPP